MALPVWGNLQKSQIDAETIEEAIARLIQAHEDDPNAHLEVGESLQSHKVAEIIDHLAESIIADKFKDGKVEAIIQALGIQWLKPVLLGFFGTHNGWTAVGDVIDGANNVQLRTTADLNDDTDLWTDWEVIFTKNPALSVKTRQSSYTDCQTILSIGTGPDEWGDGEAQATAFIWDDGVLKATIIKNGATHQTVIPGISHDAWDSHRYRIENSFGNYVKFYVDGVLEHTEITNLPSTPIQGPQIQFRVKTLTTAIKRLNLEQLTVYQDE